MIKKVLLYSCFVINLVTSGNLKLARPLVTIPYSVSALALDSSQTLLAIGDQKGNLTFFDMKQNTIKTTIKFTHAIRSLDFHPSKPLLAVGTTAKLSNLFIINVDGVIGSNRSALMGHMDWVSCVTFNHAGTMLASTSDDRTAKIWDTATNTLLYSLQDPETKKDPSYYLLTASFNSNDTLLAIAGAQSVISIWDMAAKPEPKLILTKVIGPASKNYNFSTAAFHPKNPLICAFTTSGGILEIFDVSSNAIIKTFNKIELDPLFVTWHPTGNYLLTRYIGNTGGIIVSDTKNNAIYQLTVPEDRSQMHFCNIVISTSFHTIMSGFLTKEGKGVVYAWDDPTVEKKGD